MSRAGGLDAIPRELLRTEGKRLVAGQAEPLQCVNQVTRGAYACDAPMELLTCIAGGKQGEQFPAVVVALAFPRCTIELFSTRKMVLTGRVDMEQMAAALWILRVRVLTRTQGKFDLRFTMGLVQNVVAKACVGHLVDLDKFYRDPRFSAHCRYTPELFGGLTYTPAKQPLGSPGNMTVVIFTYGTMIVTGGRSMKDTSEVYERTRTALRQFILKSK